MIWFLRVFLFTLPFASLFCFDKVIIWGHKLHSHTHSYVHKRFYRAFQYLGYPTYWFDNADRLNDFDFSNALFLTEGQVDQKIPIRDDGYYILHNCDRKKYEHLFAKGQCVILQVYTDRALLVPNLTKLDEFIYCDFLGKCVYMPWASDLLPHEIEEVQKNLPIPKQNCVYLVWSLGDGVFGNIHQINPFKKACKENGISFIHSNAGGKGLSEEEARRRIQTSYLAPTIVGKWQQEEGYIPCRIFITISNGQMGVTNSRHVYELFEKKIVYHPDSYQLFYNAKERLQTWSLQDQYDLMELVKTKHTYLNRIEVLLKFFEQIKDTIELD